MLHKPGIRIFLTSLAIVFAGTGLFAQASEDDSPFLSTAASQAAGAVGTRPQSFELAGASITNQRTEVCIYDVQSKRSHWITVGESSNQIQVISYDPVKDEVVIRANGTKESLVLRKPTVAVLPSRYSSPPIPFSPATASPDSLHLAPQPAPKSLDMAKQEREARMLVSDLLEIGIRQRKAYEEAAQKAAANK